jgi:outer membrane protein insertion porin family
MVQVQLLISVYDWLDSSKGLRFYLTLSFFLLFATSFGQEITEVRFEGNKKTQVQYLHQFVQTSVGQVLDSAQLEADRQQLVNLEMFASAAYEVERMPDGWKVTFQLSELFTFVPFVNFGRIDENYWTKVGVSEVNFLGKGHKITGYHQYYDRHSMALHLQLQRINGSPFSWNISAIKWGTLEPLFFEEAPTAYNYDNYHLGNDFIYHLNFTDHLLVGAAIFREVYDAVETPASGAPDFAAINKSLFKAQYSSYKVNSHNFYRDGLSKFFTAEWVYSFNGDPLFWITFTEWKGYKRIKNKGNLAWRAKVGLSSNAKNPFAPFVLDSYLNIRGVGDRVDRGTGMIVTNIEYRHTIWESSDWALTSIAFSDLGSWRLPGGDFTDFTNPSNQVLFCGLGGRVIMKKVYNAILRVDYGWDLLHQTDGGLVLGIGQYF